ncbi:MBL fold metallo-hydrolase, partial [Neobacillus fumarioli]|uniref:MBL fold metallo-hydrolase n=1 Tax=Neobacillus fumarioli TaxID=105229 RepID=UPI0022870923
MLECEEEVLMIDPIYDSYQSSFFGQPLEELYELSSFKKPDLIAITHLHSDHFDPVSIRTHFGRNVRIIVPKQSVEQIKLAGFNNITGLEVGESFLQGNFEIFAESSVDGLGDKQVSWVVRSKEQTIIHCGDTLWHGFWWKITEKYGPIDVAFLPINAAVVREEGMIPSNQPICMGPEQAIAAAKILRCKILVPIHYGTFYNGP